MITACIPLLCTLFLASSLAEGVKSKHYFLKTLFPSSEGLNASVPHLARGGANLSADFDLELQYGHQCYALSHVFEQGACPACITFSLASLLGARLCLLGLRRGRNAMTEMPCPYRMFDCAGGKCSVQKGLNAPQIMEIMQRGVPLLHQTPPYFGWGCHGQSGVFKARMYRHVCGIDRIRRELVQNGPVLLFIDLQRETMEFGEWESQPHHKNQSQKNSRVSIHSLMIMGWSLSPIPHWIVKNSWGEGWGKRGKGRVQWKKGDCGLVFEPQLISS